MPHRVATLLAAVLLAALPSAAVDLTGTWEAAKGLRCKIRSNADAGFVETVAECKGSYERVSSVDPWSLPPAPRPAASSRPR